MEPFFTDKKLLLEHLTDPWPFNNQFWTNAAFRGGENADQQDLSAAVLNCKCLGWVNQKTQDGGEMPPWSPGSGMGLWLIWTQRTVAAPVLVLLIRWALGEPCRGKVLQCHRQKIPVAARTRGDVAPSAHHSPAQDVLAVLHPPPSWRWGKPCLHPSRIQQPAGNRISLCLSPLGHAGKPSPLFLCLAGSSCSWFLSAPVISSLWPLQSFGKGRSKDPGLLLFIYLGG